MTTNPSAASAAHNTSSLLSKLPDVALVLDPMGRITFASAGSAELLGSRPRDWVGLSVLDRIHPDDGSEVVKRLKLAVTGQPTPTTALRLRVSSGVDQWRRAAVHGFVPIDADGLTGTLILFRDVTGALTRESIQQDALQTVFDRKSPAGENQRRDRDWVIDVLLPQLFEVCEPGRPLVGVIVMTLGTSDRRNEQIGSGVLANPLGQLARRVREILRPSDVLSRLGESQLVIVCSGLTDPSDVVEIARRLHRWCRADSLSTTCSLEAELATGCAIASDGDNAAEVLDFAASSDGQVELGAFISAAA